MLQRLTADDFFTGLFSALAEKKESVFSLRGQRFDKAVEQTFSALVARAPSLSLDLRFRIRLHPIHGDSSTIRDAISRAAQRDIVGLDNPEFQDVRLKVTGKDAPLLLASLPAGPALYAELADRFMRYYAA